MTTLITRFLQFDSYDMSFSTAHILRHMRHWLTPVSFPRRESVHFGPTVRVGDFELGVTENIDDASGMRMHWLFVSRLKPIFEYSALLVVEQDVVVLGR
jgi:hypothetical protein